MAKKSKRVKAWMCVACHYRIAEDAYYCKKCGAIVSTELHPENRTADKRFSTRLRLFLQMNPFQKAAWGAVFAVAIASGSYYFFNLHGAISDNGSSKIFSMNVDTAYSPFGCSGPVCHMSITLTNKTDSAQTLTGSPQFTGDDGVVRGPADPRNGTGAVIYYGNLYCQKDFNLTFKPHEQKRFLCVCVQGLVRGSYLKKVAIVDATKKVVVNTDLNAMVPLL
jgi:hypothetical protein